MSGHSRNGVQGKLLGGIEAGGTKFICLIGRSPDDILAEMQIPTRSPAETLGEAVSFFQQQQKKHGSISALGIASFGPIDLDVSSPKYGHILSTAKSAWAGVNFPGPFRSMFKMPIALDTDVNGAALAEQYWGAARNVRDFVYVTVGTGIGGGVMIDGALHHGALHPEIGHMFIPHDLVKDPFPGLCPFHGDCLEGLVSGPAIAARLNTEPWNAAADDPVWDLTAEYLAMMCVNLTMVLSPMRIVLGGGVMQQSHLMPKIRRHFAKCLNDYIRIPLIKDNPEQYIVAAGLGNRSGAYGALLLADRALD